MTRPRILLLGAGGHGKAVADLLLAHGGFDVAGFLDAAPKLAQVLGLPVLGDESRFAALLGDPDGVLFLGRVGQRRPGHVPGPRSVRRPLEELLLPPAPAA